MLDLQCVWFRLWFRFYFGVDVSFNAACEPGSKVCWYFARPDLSLAVLLPNLADQIWQDFVDGRFCCPTVAT